MKPKHIAIIPDGNRRWAKNHGVAEYLAHIMPGSYNHLSKLIETAHEENLEVFSMWAFSTENWLREKREVEELIGVIERGLDSFIHNAQIDKHRFRIIGRKDRLPIRVLEKINELEKETETYIGMNVVLGIDYGGRDELIRAVNIAITKGEFVDEEKFKSFLYTTGLPDPDLIIRTGGERRLSGYMPFQSLYSEIDFSDKLFPDYTSKDLKESIRNFERRKRSFGR